MPSAGFGSMPPAVAAIQQYRLSVKDWGNRTTLDLSRPTAYLNWYDQAVDFLAPPGRADIKALLKWAEKQQSPIDLAAEIAGVREVAAMQGLRLREGEDGVGFISDTILSALRFMIHDNLLGRARAAGRGLELWRKLRAEARGSAPALAAVKAQQWSQPKQSSSMAALWTDLDEWLLLGQEVEEGSMHSMTRPDWLKLQSLKALLPNQLRDQLRLQLPNGDYEESLVWIRRQMEFQRGDAQATAFTKSTDKSINEVRSELEAAKAREEEIAWYLYHGDEDTINAIRKGKGGKGGKGKKGNLLGKGGRAAQQPQNPKNPKGGSKGIKGNCWNCGKQGHMASNCPEAKKVNELTGETAENAEQSPSPQEAATEEAAQEAAAAAAWWGSAGPAWNLLGSVSAGAPPGAEEEEREEREEREEDEEWELEEPVPSDYGGLPSSPPPRQQQRERQRPGTQPAPQPQPPLWRPSLRQGQRLPEQRREATAAFDMFVEAWPSPCSVAAIQSPVRDGRSNPPASLTTPSSPRRRRKWSMLQGVWSETPLETAPPSLQVSLAWLRPPPCHPACGC